MSDLTLEACRVASRAFHATERLPHSQRVASLNAMNEAWRAHFVPAIEALDRQRSEERQLAKDALVRAFAAEVFTDAERAAIKRVFL